MNFSRFSSILLILLSPLGIFGYSLTAFNIATLTGNFIENIAVRPNGQIIVTSSQPFPRLWQIDPLKIRAPILIATFEGTIGTLGITEVQPDVYYVATGNITFNGTYVLPASAFSIWRVNMVDFQAVLNGTIVRPAKLSKVIDMPSFAGINGMTSISSSSGFGPSFLLAADSMNGVVWRVTLPENGQSQVSVAINDTTMLPPPPSHSLGINGIKYFNSSVYYTNSAASAFYTYPIDPRTAEPPKSSSARLIANVTVPDDFILDTVNPSYAFVCSQGLGSVLQVDITTGTTVSVAANLTGPSAVAWGRDTSDDTSLYLTTNGGAVQTAGTMQGVSRIDVG